MLLDVGFLGQQNTGPSSVEDIAKIKVVNKERSGLSCAAASSQ